MTAALAAAPLDVARARRLTRQLQEALDLALDLLLQVHDGQAWRALGHSSWGEYCAAELPQLAILGKGMAEPERVAAVGELRGQGMSFRAIAAALGLGVATVKRAADDAGVQLATVTSLDGRKRSTTSAPRRRRSGPPRTDRTVLLVAGFGTDGATVLDVVAATRWKQHVASATLTRLVQAGRLAYLAPERRGQFGRYVATT